MTKEVESVLAAWSSSGIGWLLRAGIAFLALVPLLLESAPASGGLKQYDRIRVLETARPIDSAELIDQNGRPFRLSSLKGKVAFVLFGYTNCPDVCPLVMERLRALHSSNALKDAKVAYVLISVDGDRDNPAAVKAFLAKYSKDFIGLTGDPSQVKTIADQFSASFFKGAQKARGPGYDVTHSPQIFVLDTSGGLRAEVYGATTETVTNLAQDLLAEAG